MLLLYFVDVMHASTDYVSVLVYQHHVCKVVWFSWLAFELRENRPLGHLLGDWSHAFHILASIQKPDGSSWNSVTVTNSNYQFLRSQLTVTTLLKFEHIWQVKESDKAKLEANDARIGHGLYWDSTDKDGVTMLDLSDVSMNYPLVMTNIAMV